MRRLRGQDVPCVAQLTQEGFKTHYVGAKPDRTAHLTVFQRTPNLALPMRQRKLDADTIRRMKEGYPSAYQKRRTSFGGFDYEFLPKSASEVSEDERQATFERVWEIGGFAPWVGSFNDLMANEESNRAAYHFSRDKTRARITDASSAQILAPP